MIGAGGVAVAQPALQRARGGPSPTPALHDLWVKPVSFTLLKSMFTRHHYLHSLAGGHRLGFGCFIDGQLKGGVALNVGPFMAHRLVDGIKRDDMVALSRLWLDDELPPNSESHVLGVVLRSLRRHTTLKAVISYADSGQGHLGVVYQACNFLYLGESDRMPRFDVGDGRPRHSRSLSAVVGSHSVKYLKANGVPIHVVATAHKHRYVYLLDPSLRDRLTVPVLPYPKKEVRGGRD